MTNEQFLRNLQVPGRRVDVVLDTDTYNEIDDQFAAAYLLHMPQRAHICGFTAAPFLNARSTSPADGMEKSLGEIRKILTLAGREDLLDRTFRGSDRFLPDEDTPEPSDAADFLAQQALSHTADDPLYIVAIGAVTNVASAFLLHPRMKESAVVVWLGGHARWWVDTREFNMMQDVAAARVIFGCGVPLVQVPCIGVADRFLTTRYELEHWLGGKNALCDYLVHNTVGEAERYAAERPWSRVIWDVTAVAWLVNDGERFLHTRLTPAPIPEYDNRYADAPERHLMRTADWVNRDALFADLVRRLTENG